MFCERKRPDLNSFQTSYALKYKFQITSRGDPTDCDPLTEKQPPAEVDLARHQVTVPAWAMEICDPAGRIFEGSFREMPLFVEM
jgi:hypothetical protein